MDKEYTLIKLENEYLELQILPEIGGKIYAAKDKTNGYDFFYKNHVIKPALIGALGSWISVDWSLTGLFIIGLHLLCPLIMR